MARMNEVGPEYKPIGIEEFVKAKKRSKCVVCSLPAEIRAQLQIAREKDINRATVREWLKTEYGKEVSEADFASHTSGHHES